MLAIGAGVIEGARYGINLESAFLTRGVMEMQLFAEHFGSDTRTFYGLAGIGDLMLTSNSFRYARLRGAIQESSVRGQNRLRRDPELDSGQLERRSRGCSHYGARIQRVQTTRTPLASDVCDAQAGERRN